MKKIVIILLVLLIRTLVFAAIPIDFEKSLTIELEPYHYKTFSFSISETSRVRISLKNAQSDVGWFIFDETDGDPEEDDTIFKYDCDFNGPSNNPSLDTNDESCEIILRPGKYNFYVDEYNHIKTSVDILVSLQGVVKIEKLELGEERSIDDLNSENLLFKLENKSIEFVQAYVTKASHSAQIEIYNSKLALIKTCQFNDELSFNCPALLKAQSYYFRLLDKKESPSSFRISLDVIQKKEWQLGIEQKGVMRPGELLVGALKVIKPNFFDIHIEAAEPIFRFQVYNSKFENIGDRSCDRLGYGIRCNLFLESGDYSIRIEGSTSVATTFRIRLIEVTPEGQIEFGKVVNFRLKGFQMKMRTFNVAQNTSVQVKLELGASEYVRLFVQNKNGQVTDIDRDAPFFLKAGEYKVYVVNSMETPVDFELKFGAL